ncbi:hypothetical protein AAFF_G00207050 [Aldrovandia affinis]|uniref:Uncharacterized protein n=1 Tax=Aldrovandia affinis TaxID=143900 RepID=A0AAD7RHE9_9TELE|nr:hypothetical protein AAFF_G00207050 [Aldrovandia affinis]
MYAHSIKLIPPRAPQPGGGQDQMGEQDSKPDGSSVWARDAMARAGGRPALSTQAPGLDPRLTGPTFKARFRGPYRALGPLRRSVARHRPAERANGP